MPSFIQKATYSASGGFEFTSPPNAWHSTKDALRKMLSNKIPSSSELDGWGRVGVDALKAATPVDSGLTGDSWKYEVVADDMGPIIKWYNTNFDDQGVSVAILLQYGHGTGTGGYIQGRDYINPAILPVYEQILDTISKEVTM